LDIDKLYNVKVHDTISVVIPALNDSEYLIKVIGALNSQTLLPKEIIIVDSSEDGRGTELVAKMAGQVPIIYKKVKKAYPGKARNIGVGMAKGELIAFLDCKTVPKKDWLERYITDIRSNNAQIVFGVTKYRSVTSFQRILMAATYGQVGLKTVPGTLIIKSIFLESGGFLENARMAEDIEWRERVASKGFRIHTPQKESVIYTGLPENLLIALKKYLTSSFHTARVDVLKNMKDAYLGLMLILVTLILPKWNFLIEGWKNNPLYIPHITKIYLIALIIVFLGYKITRFLFFKKAGISISGRILKVIIFIFISGFVYKWNGLITGWVEDAILYIPHITKIYLSGLILFSVIYRGIFTPLKRKISAGYLFPARWLIIGLLGLSLDIAKAPGYVFGAVFGLYLPFHSKKSRNY
jgi:glycosyltransferase involved in cell wall biosynthesis